MKIGEYEIIHHTDTVKPEPWVVFWKPKGKLERAAHIGKRGGFRTLAEAAETVTKIVKYGSVKA